MPSISHTDTHTALLTYIINTHTHTHTRTHTHTPYALVLACCWQNTKYVFESVHDSCVYLVVEVVECRFVFCKLLHEALWKIPDPQLIPTEDKG